MRFLADENFPRVAVEALRKREHDVAWVATDGPGTDDTLVLARAVSKNRVLLTFDKDFGELAFRHNLPTSCGVILFRISPDSPERVAQIAVAVTNSRDDWSGHFTVVEDDRLRMIRLT